MDIDLDGTAELLLQNCVYSASNCSRLWCSPGSVSVFPGAANFDKSTPEAKVVMAGGGLVELYNHKGRRLWNVSVSSDGGPPAIADFNGDRVPDIVMSHFTNYFIFSGVDGSLLRNETVFESSTTTGSSSFDFDSDGAYEMIYVSSNTFYIFSMNWTKTFTRSSTTATEYSLVADIDLDGSADIVSVGYAELKVFGSNDTLPDATSAWTTHGHNTHPLQVPRDQSNQRQPHQPTPTRNQTRRSPPDFRELQASKT